MYGFSKDCDSLKAKNHLNEEKQDASFNNSILSSIDRPDTKRKRDFSRQRRQPRMAWTFGLRQQACQSFQLFRGSIFVNQEQRRLSNEAPRSFVLETDLYVLSKAHTREPPHSRGILGIRSVKNAHNTTSIQGKPSGPEASVP